MDGFMGGSASSGNSSNKTHKIRENTNLLKSPNTSTRFKAAAQGVHQRAQRSQTLMRSAVKKPAQAVSSAANTTTRLMQPKARVASVDKSRVSRAQAVSQDAKVRRFGHVVKDIPAKPYTAAQSASKSPASAAARTSANSVLYKPLPSMVTSASQRQLERMLDEALTRADAHKRAFRANANIWQKIKFAPRWQSVGATLLAIVLLTAFVAWQKVPQVAMRVAATRAHVNAHIPGYVPSGFSFAGPVHYDQGSVSVNYQANGNTSRTFTLTQKSSNLDSKSLADSVVPKNTQVQTSVVQGTTVYIYGENNDAAWANHGVTYTIHDTANLNSDQLLKIAGSL